MLGRANSFFVLDKAYSGFLILKGFGQAELQRYKT
ncbi:hypothetical protein AusDCA_4360 [Desulfitobacterium sp. AusDCA]